MPGQNQGFFKEWHIRKEFHLGHLLTMMMLLGAIITSVVQIHGQQVKFSASLGETERRIELLEARAASAESTAASLSGLLERLDERSVRQTQQLDRIERRLEAREGPR